MLYLCNNRNNSTMASRYAAGVKANWRQCHGKLPIEVVYPGLDAPTLFILLPVPPSPQALCASRRCEALRGQFRDGFDEIWDGFGKFWGGSTEFWMMQGACV